MASGLVQLDGAGAGPALLVSTISDGGTAATVVLAMTTGLLVPKLLIDAVVRGHDVTLGLLGISHLKSNISDVRHQL